MAGWDVLDTSNEYIFIYVYVMCWQWDGSIGEWTYKPDVDKDETSGEDTLSDSDSDGDRSHLRRSERIRKQRRQQTRPRYIMI